jgi:hypothetical protein
LVCIEFREKSAKTANKMKKMGSKCFIARSVVDR